MDGTHGGIQPDDNRPGPARPADRPLNRRGFLRLAGAAGAVTLAGCGTGGGGKLSGQPVRLGLITPSTGALAAFGEADGFVIQHIGEYFAANGIKTSSGTRPVEITVVDNQSDGKRSERAAAQLIDRGVDVVLVTSDSAVINPVAALCERRRTPCVSTVSAWEPVFLRDKGRPPARGSWRYTTHFFSSGTDVVAVYAALWNDLASNKTIGALWPDTSTGHAMNDPNYGLPAQFGPLGFKLLEMPSGGYYKPGTASFRAEVDRIREGAADIITGGPDPADFATFWKQADTAKLTPKIVTPARALLFPSFVEALRPSGAGLSTEVFWSPEYPYRSSLNGMSARQLADEYIRRTEKQWTQPIGFAHALFEVAAHAITTAGDPTDREAVAKALRGARLDSVVGPLDFHGDAKRRVPEGVALAPLVGGQWRKGAQFPYDLVIVNNKTAPEIPAAGELQAL